MPKDATINRKLQPNAFINVSVNINLYLFMDNVSIKLSLRNLS